MREGAISRKVAREFESTPLRQRVTANRCLVVAFSAAARMLSASEHLLNRQRFGCSTLHEERLS
jgi:hypothetical protein